MTNRERVLAILNYENYDRIPLVAFGYWRETVEKWAAEGHVTPEESEGWITKGDGSDADLSIMKKLGFDFGWQSCIVGANHALQPGFKTEVLEELSDGQQTIRDGQGLIVRIKPGLVSIPSEVGTTLTNREAWEELYLPKLQFSMDRINEQRLKTLTDTDRELPRGLHCGSLMGKMRDLLGVEHLSYLYADDEDLYTEIIDTLCGLCYQVTEAALKTGAKFEYGHYWEDICFKNGPLVAPSVFHEKVGPHYKRMTELLNRYGVGIISLDCDGMIDSLIPTWLENGVNTMFPIEVGTWNASIAPWREKYGRAIRGVGGMDKRVFAMDYAAVDLEIERLKRLIDLGGYIPCPDHRIAPDAKWENVQYYCYRFRNIID